MNYVCIKGIYFLIKLKETITNKMEYIFNYWQPVSILNMRTFLVNKQTNKQTNKQIYKWNNASLRDIFIGRVEKNMWSLICLWIADCPFYANLMWLLNYKNWIYTYTSGKCKHSGECVLVYQQINIKMRNSFFILFCVSTAVCRAISLLTLQTLTFFSINPALDVF